MMEGDFLEIRFTTDRSVYVGSLLSKLTDGERFTTLQDADYRYEDEPKTYPPTAQITKAIRLWAPDLVALHEDCRRVITHYEGKTGQSIPVEIEIKEGEKKGD